MLVKLKLISILAFSVEGLVNAFCVSFGRTLRSHSENKKQNVCITLHVWWVWVSDSAFWMSRAFRNILK